MFAAGNGLMHATKALLGAGADADNRDDDGRGAMQWADDADHGAIVSHPRDLTLQEGPRSQYPRPDPGLQTR